MSSQPKQEQPDESEVVAVEYQCPYCEFTEEFEFIVRAHINRSDDDTHRHRNGFMPEDEVPVVDAGGDVVRTERGNPRTRHEWLHGLSVDDLPDRLTEVERLIVLTALQNLPEQYSELETLANERLREADYDPVSYNKVYRTVKDTFAVQTESKKTMSQAEEQSPHDVYEGLTEKQRAVINEYIRDDEQNMSEIADGAGVDPSYPKQVIEQYGWLTDELTNADVIPVDDADDFADDEAADGPSSRNDPTPTGEKAYDDLTSLQQEVIDELVEHPEKSNKEIAADVGCDVTYPGKISDNFTHIIEQRREDTQDADGVTTISLGDTEYQVPANIAAEYTGLTEKQQQVIAELVTEDNPAEPARSHEDIGEDAGVHRTYAKEVVEKYGDIAATIKAEGLRVETPAAPSAETEDTEGAEATAAAESEEDEGGTVEWDDAADPAETAAAEDAPFTERFEAAVEAGDMTHLTVQEIRSGIGDITDRDVLERAQELDTRKTATAAYDDQLDDLGDEMEAEEPSDTDVEADDVEAEPEVEDESDDDVEAESDVEPDAEPTTSRDQPAEPATAATAQGGVPVTELQEMRDRVDMLLRTASSELEESDDKAPAARAKSVAEEFERMLDTTIAQYADGGEQSQA